jgi:hypothetical protein
MHMTAELRRQLTEAIDGEAWDRPGETTERDATLAHLDAVPTGTVLAPAADEFDADEQPVTDLAHVWVIVDYFGFQNVAGDWHGNAP